MNTYTKQYQFQYDCVNPVCKNELEYIIDNMEEISKKEFLKSVGINHCNDVLRYRISYTKKIFSR